MQRIRLLLTILTVALLAAGCATRNMLPDGAGGKAILAGYDPVSYHSGTPVKGDPKITAEWDGGLYYFANERTRTEFQKSPERYAPAYGGYCANGAPYSILLGGGADSYKMVNGRLYMFSGPGSKRLWEMDEARNIEVGDKYWAEELKNVNSAFIHSYYRILLNKVPHYKSDNELREEWRARHGKKG